MFGLDAKLTRKTSTKRLSKIFKNKQSNTAEEEQQQSSAADRSLAPKLPPTAPPAPLTSVLQRSASQRQQPSHRNTSAEETGNSKRYEWIDFRGRTTSPPPSFGSKTDSSKVIEFEVNRDMGLGITLRGGVSHDLGVFVSGVDEGSSAAESGLRVGDQILAFNGNSWIKSSTTQGMISLEEAVRQVVRATNSCQRPVLCFRVRSTGKVPSATLVRTTSFSGSFDPKTTQIFERKKSLIPSSRCDLVYTSFGGKTTTSTTTSRQESSATRRRLSSRASPETTTTVTLESPEAAEEANEPMMMHLLSESEKSTFRFFRAEYTRGRLPAQSLGNFLRQFCDRQDVREALAQYVLQRVLRVEDRQLFVIGNQSSSSRRRSVSPETMTSSVSPEVPLEVPVKLEKPTPVFLEITEEPRGEKRRLSSSNDFFGGNFGGNSSNSLINRRRCSSLHLQHANERQKRLLPGIPMTSSDLNITNPRRGSVLSTTSASSEQRRHLLPSVPLLAVPSDQRKRHNSDYDLSTGNQQQETNANDFRRHSSCLPPSLPSNFPSNLLSNLPSNLPSTTATNIPAKKSSNQLLCVPNINVRRSSVDVEAGNSSEEEDSSSLLLLPPTTSSLRRGSGNHLTIPGEEAPLYLLLPQVESTTTRIGGNSSNTQTALHSRVRRHRSLPSPFIHGFGASFAMDSSVMKCLNRRPSSQVTPSAAAAEQVVQQPIKSSPSSSTTHTRSSSFRRPVSVTVITVTTVILQ